MKVMYRNWPARFREAFLLPDSPPMQTPPRWTPSAKSLRNANRTSRTTRIFEGRVTKMLTRTASLLSGLLVLQSAIYAATIGATAVTPMSVPAGVGTLVTVTATITDPTVIASTVNVQQLNAQGVATVLGTMHDDGLAGDVVAGDKIFTLQTTIFQPNPGSLSLRVSAGFQGSLTRTFSPLMTLTITGTATGISIGSPAVSAYLNTSPTLVTGTVGDHGAQVTVNGIVAQLSGGSFSASVPLQEGSNTISAVANNSNGTTSTDSRVITLDTTPPHVTIDSPANSAVTTDASITVTGMVNDIVVGTVNNQQATVTVNGVQATVVNRSFTVSNIPLSLGSNTIQATGRDRAGNGATTSVTITRQALTQPSLRIISGNNLSGPIRTLLAAPLVVQLVNGSGQAIPNTPVVFHVTGGDGTVTTAGPPGMSSIAVNTNSQGQAQVNMILGSRAGAGNNLVTASSAGVATTPIFAESGNSTAAAMIVVDSGNDQSGVVGQALPLPFIAIVTDAGHNRIGNVPVTFTVPLGGGTFSGQPSYTTTSDSDGRVEAVLTLGPADGINNNQVQATFTGNAGLPVTFTATGRIPGPAANTIISGVVLTNSNQPISGVTMRLFQTQQGNNSNIPQQVGTPVQTNAQGYFQVQPAPVGVFKLMADGTTAGNYPTLEYDLVTVAGLNNTVGSPIYLPLLNAGSQLCVNQTTGGTLTIPQAPGFSLTIAAGSATFPGGSRSGCVSVTPVNRDKIPMVPGFGQQPRFIVTIQPVGATFNPPAAITIPNVDGLAPRAVTEMYSYDHDLASFVAIGTGTVSTDGSVIASDPGVGVLKAGWHCGGDPNSSGSAETVTVTLSAPKVILGVGKTASITATGAPTPIGTPAYTWTSAASGTATVVAAAGSQAHPNTATVTGVAAGKTTGSVTYRCQSGANATANFDISVVMVKFDKTGDCTGFDATVMPPAIMAPVGGTNMGNAIVTPAASASDVKLVSVAAGTATVAPAALSASPQMITVSGVAAGGTQIQAKPASGPDSVLATLQVDVKNSLTKKVAIHAITEQNDDVQTVPVGKGQPNQPCIGPGANGVIDTAPGGDDVKTGTSITTGPDGICNTAKTGDDVQVIPVGQGAPNGPCVGAGANAFRDTAAAAGDDVIAGNDINSGPNGICETAANQTNLVPMNAPTAAALQDYLNNTIWGKQANVMFTVTRSDFTVNYDLNRDGGLADAPLDEVNAISAVAKDATADINVYYVKALEVPQATTVIGLHLTWIQDTHVNSTVNVSAHEIGHELGIAYESMDPIDVMLSFGSATNPCNVKQRDWNTVNP
jgi:hypothetical protein